MKSEKWIRIRHLHDAQKIDGLSERMLRDGVVKLDVEKVFKDLGQLKNFSFLEELKIRQLKRGISVVGKLGNLRKLSLWDIRNLDSRWVSDLHALEEFKCYGTKFAPFETPSRPSSLETLSLRTCNGFNNSLDLGDSTSLRRLYIEDCGDLVELSDCRQLDYLETVTITNVPDFQSLKGLKHAPNLNSIVIQLTPKLPPEELEWMLDHPTLQHVYPLVERNSDSSGNQRISEMLAPRFGPELFQQSGGWMENHRF